jgi:hypothetical protein
MQVEALSRQYNNIIVNHSFSNKPSGGFKDYYEKVTSYVRVISSQAAAIDPDAKAATFAPIATVIEDSVFNYLDTNSSRAEITAITSKTVGMKIAIIGVGGTGSYILDFMAKTPVKEIHLYDGDAFYSHNAFRAPGAISLEELKTRPKKVRYLHSIYSRMHKGIIPHEHHVSVADAEDLSTMDFVYLSIDDGDAKKEIVALLIRARVPFVDAGMGIQTIDHALSGSIRVTTVTPNKQDHVEKRISFGDGGNDDYAQNIQIAELNALNAALAVIKWKKLFGIYHDLEQEHHSVYEININKVLSDEACA